MAEDIGTKRAPGTVLLEERQGSKDRIVLHPVPSDDPNDPLNWSTFRKSINFGLTCTFVCLTFVLLDNVYVAYEPYSEELGATYGIYNQTLALNYAGLAVGSIFFIPFVHRYGRRPLYLMSTAVQLATSIWAAEMKNSDELRANSFIGGLGGALSETIALITIGDLFFVHHHALMNGIFLLMQSIGAFIGPVVMGYAVENQGWRWMWKITTILIGINLFASLLFFEETKYTRVHNGIPQQPEIEPAVSHQPKAMPMDEETRDLELEGSQPNTEVAYPRKSYRQRLALATPTNEPVLRHFYQPILIFFTIPGVFYASLTYGTMLAWLALMSSATSYYGLLPPYNLTPHQIGLTNLGPFVGLLIGTIIFSPASDWSIIKLSRRNKGIFEPEMRLWLALVGALLCFSGLMMFGYCLANGQSLMSVLVGSAMYCVGFVICADVSLTYVLDCYQDIIGDSMVVIVFCRNIIAVIILFINTPWIAHMGLKNTFLTVSCLCLTVLLALPIVLLTVGKKLRILTAPKFQYFARRQASYRQH